MYDFELKCEQGRALRRKFWRGQVSFFLVTSNETEQNHGIDQADQVRRGR